MSSNPADFRGLLFLKDEELEGKKYGVMIEGSREVRVSPAVYELIQTDPDSVSKVLTIKILPVRRPSRPKRQGRGG
jgi:hypothetical protein